MIAWKDYEHVKMTVFSNNASESKLKPKMHWNTLNEWSYQKNIVLCNQMNVKIDKRASQGEDDLHWSSCEKKNYSKGISFMREEFNLHTHLHRNIKTCLSRCLAFLSDENSLPKNNITDQRWIAHRIHIARHHRIRNWMRRVPFTESSNKRPHRTITKIRRRLFRTRSWKHTHCGSTDFFLFCSTLSSLTLAIHTYNV